jgi:hypothetical protein
MVTRANASKIAALEHVAAPARSNRHSPARNPKITNRRVAVALSEADRHAK